MKKIKTNSGQSECVQTYSSPVALLVGRECLYCDLLGHYLRTAISELTLIQARFAQQIEPHLLPQETVVVLLDLDYAESEFLYVIETVSRMLPDAPIAVISDFRSNYAQLAQLRVRAYVSSRMSVDILVRTLRVLLDDRFYETAQLPALDIGPKNAHISNAAYDSNFGSARLARGDLIPPLVTNQAKWQTRQSADTQAIFASLTEREREVLHCLQAGMPNKVIGAELGLEESVIKLHMRNLMRRFGVRNRVELVVTTMGARSPSFDGVAQVGAAEERSGQPDAVRAQAVNLSDRSHSSRAPERCGAPKREAVYQTCRQSRGEVLLAPD